MGATVFATEPRDILHDATAFFYSTSDSAGTFGRSGRRMPAGQPTWRSLGSSLSAMYRRNRWKLTVLELKPESPPSISLIDVLTLAKAAIGDKGGA